MSGSIYTHSNFEPDEFSNGGCKRTAQIHEILNKNNIPFTIADFEPHQPKPRSLPSYLRGITHNKRLSLNLRNDHNTGRYIKAFERFIDKNKPSLFIWESLANQHFLLGNELYKRKIPFIALPHNLESLLIDNHSFTSNVNSPNWFTEELKYLRYPNKVFTISLEERWLLSIYGIDVDYLPYYPTTAVTSYLLNIREEREKNKKYATPKKILLLGTFYNKPTLQGYVDLLSQSEKFKDIIFNVAGFGSEILESYNSSNIKIWGSVDTTLLRELIIENDIVLLNQPPTSGALTKIPELLIAGVPIFANHNASRSYYGLDGIHVYHNYQELFDLMHSISPPIPNIPAPPEAAEKRFVDYIKIINRV
ncbi:MAG: glycosyltransferase [Mucilaginibacter sp.]|nr:glycosyltransferase [Mucilaginibacter sp.]